MPRYLQNIKVGLAQQHAEKQAAKEAAMVPPGMRIMPEEERLEMLGILDESRQDVEAKLQVMSVCVCLCVSSHQVSDQSVPPAEVCMSALQSYLFVSKSYSARVVCVMLTVLPGQEFAWHGLLLVVPRSPCYKY